MFEVLWKAEDWSWMTYEQVKELNLIKSYLKLLEYKKIEELINIRTEKDPKDKGKGKATEEEEMEINTANIPLPEDDFIDKELKNLLKSPKDSARKAD
ncbi:hypothetical protein E4T56_gene8069 [Termitomyces sp. T112]|nr:hypothetical protein E4T56_gene8069 [Termitomyces sp. T112]